MKSAYLVTKDSVPCHGVGKGTFRRRWLLAPAPEGTSPKVFARKATAQAALLRTLEFARDVRTSYFSEWPAAREIVKPGQYLIETLHRYGKRTGVTIAHTPAPRAHARAAEIQAESFT